MPDTKVNKITYGLSNVHVWPILSTGDDGTPAYGEIIKVPGAKEMTLSAEGETVKFYADNIVYWTAEANNGYSGNLNIADVPATFAEKILKQIRDVNGVLVENASETGAEFAMAMEFEGDTNKRKHVFYRCTVGRPDVSSSTKEENIEPNVAQLNITAMPRLDNHFVKASIEDTTSTAYENWYGEAPYEPTLTATPVVPGGNNDDQND